MVTGKLREYNFHESTQVISAKGESMKFNSFSGLKLVFMAASVSLDPIALLTNAVIVRSFLAGSE